jgi:pectate lyase
MAKEGGRRTLARGRLSAVVAACLVAGCSTQVAQTAFLDPNHLLDCTAPGGVALPEDAVFGDGGEPPSILVGSTYGAGQGPGLYVTARDAFRVYLNGDLVAASAAARQPLFVPLTLLPGDNALAVVVEAKRGTPAALLQLDDLDQTYVSDARWKASTKPGAGYAAASYDDSSWAAASDYGAEGSMPGCDPVGTFPAGSTAHWIGPAPESGSTAVLRKVVHVVAIGYAAGTTGGGTAPATTVARWSDLEAAARDPAAPAFLLLPEGVYDFRDMPRNQPACPSTCTNDATKTEYTVLDSTETCANALVNQTRDERTLNLGSNKTIVGLGRGALIQGVSFDFGSSQNLVVRNIALLDVNPGLIAAGGAFLLSQSSQVWLDHCTAKWISENFTSLSPGAQGVTLSWVHYDGFTTNECDGEHTQAVTVNGATATVHHCFFDHVESHSPKVQNAGRVHLFNNVMSDNLGYGVGSECGAQVLMEGNTFQRVMTPTERDTCPDGGALGAISAPDGSNYYGDDVGAFHGGGSGEPHDAVFTPPYAYTVEVPQEDYLTILSRAGAGGPWPLPYPQN